MSRFSEWAFSLSSKTMTNGSRTELQDHSSKLLQPFFLLSAFALLALLIVTYSNHFRNPFQFDDTHTIVNNTAIRDLGNIPRFFTDATTSSTLPANQAWRPGVTTLNAIDTHFSENHVPDPYVFHVSIFSSYVVLGVLLFFFFLHLFRIAFPSISYAHWAALVGTGWFMLHTANAETINYIIARSDSFSTLMILLAFVLYFYSEKARKYFLFLLPVLLGFFVKEPAIMFAPLLLVYLLLFDKNKSRIIRYTSVAFLLAFALYGISRMMTPPHWTSGGGKWYWYLATQFFVIVHYFNNFLLPFNLSADTDWGLVTSFTDDRVITGAIFIGLLLVVVLICARRQETKLISFGISWFFVALIPTSSIFSFAEVLNDHRTFFPYIGLVLAFVGLVVFLLEKIRGKETYRTWRFAALGFGTVLILLHAVGTHHRNAVWHSGETLWKDVTEKSPNNGRGWMNYGLALMSRTNVDSALICFNRGLLTYPNYSYLHINMGIAYSVKGNMPLAEEHFRTAMHCDTLNPETYYYYGKFLVDQERFVDAKKILAVGHQLSPEHQDINVLLTSLNSGNVQTPIQLAEQTAKLNPTPDNYVNLSLVYYNAGEFEKSAQAAEEAVKLKPDYIIGWNNICAAYNKIGEFEKAEAAGAKALALDPKNELAKGNHAYAVSKKEYFAKVEAVTRKRNDYVGWISLSLDWYNAGNYRKCIEASEEAKKINPNDVTSWNNICAAANRLRDWDLAVAAGEKAVALDPKSELAKNNLAEAKRGKEGR